MKRISFTLTLLLLLCIGTAMAANRPKKGKLFKGYVSMCLALDQRPDYKLIAANNKNGERHIPDFVITKQQDGQEHTFAVECVYYRSMPAKILLWGSDKKVKGTKIYQQTHSNPLFFVIGIGGSPQDPAELYILPYSEQSGGQILVMSLSKYQIRDFAPSMHFHYDPDTRTLQLK